MICHSSDGGDGDAAGAAVAVGVSLRIEGGVGCTTAFDMGDSGSSTSIEGMA